MLNDHRADRLLKNGLGKIEPWAGRWCAL